MDFFLYNIGYLLSFIALAVRDILWLRCILVSAQALFVVHAQTTNNKPQYFWNLVFMLINLIQILLIIRERKLIKVPKNLENLYKNIFSDMNPGEFLYFWNTGNIQEIENKELIHEGTSQENLSLIISGEVEIVKNNKKINLLSDGNFVGEMSFLTKKLASATAIAKGKVEYISWNQNKLKVLQTLNTKLFTKIHGILGKDLAHKLNHTSLQIN